MTETRSVSDFVKLNEVELRKFLNAQYHLHQGDVTDEILSRFYLKLIRGRTLEKWNPLKGTYASYVITQLCWSMGLRNYYKSPDTTPIDGVEYMADKASSIEQNLNERINDFGRYITNYAPAGFVRELLIVLQRAIDGYPLYTGLRWEIPGLWSSMVRDFLAEERRVYHRVRPMAITIRMMDSTR